MSEEFWAFAVGFIIGGLVSMLITGTLVIIYLEG